MFYFIFSKSATRNLHHHLHLCLYHFVIYQAYANLIFTFISGVIFVLDFVQKILHIDVILAAFLFFLIFGWLKIIKIKKKELKAFLFQINLLYSYIKCIPTPTPSSPPAPLHPSLPLNILLPLYHLSYIIYH